MSNARLTLAVLFCGLAAACSDAKSAQVASAQAIATQPAGAPQPYTLKDTEVRDVHSAILNRDYQIFVALPPSYGQRPEHRYPVLFVTDADYAFPLTRSIGRRVGDHGAGLDEFVLVGLSYAKGDTPVYSRNRDYTPTAAGGLDGKISDMPGRAPAFGEGDAYRRFIKEEVFPLVAADYRVDMNPKIFAGHSIGGQLGAQMLLADPTMFDSYILSSPSLWYDHKVMFQRERDYAAAHKDLPAKVYLAVGGYETVKPGSTDPRYHKNNDLVGDNAAFAAQLKARGYPGLKLQTEVIEGEDHMTVNAITITHGLLWALPPVKR